MQFASTCRMGPIAALEYSTLTTWQLKNRLRAFRWILLQVDLYLEEANGF